MILFAKVVTLMFLFMSAVKIILLALPSDSGRGTTAIDALIYVSLGAWGLVGWVTLP